MPATEILKPLDRNAFSDNLLIHEHGIANVSAAYLLVVGRRAIHAYASARGQDLDLLIPVLADTVGLWVDANGGCRKRVSVVAQTLDEMMLRTDFAPPAKHRKAIYKKRFASMH